VLALAVALQSDGELKVVYFSSRGQWPHPDKRKTPGKHLRMWQWQTLARTSMLDTLAICSQGPFVLAVLRRFVVRGARVTSSSFRASNTCFKSWLSFFCVSFLMQSVVHSWFLSLNAFASSFFLHTRRCIAQRSTLLYVSLESSTMALPAPASTSSHSVPLLSAGVPSKGGKTHNRNKSRIMSLYNTSSLSWFCDEL